MIRIFKYFIYSSLTIIIGSCDLTSSARNFEKETVASIQVTDGFFPITKVVDGDTFWVDNGTAKGLKVRFIGIDAPESRKMFKKEIGYYGKEAKLYLTEMLTNKKVKLVSDVDSHDQYGRTLSYVYLEDGTFVNAELIKNGYAVLMTIPPNIAFSEYFAKLQKEARKNQRGLWGEEYNTPVSFEPLKKMD